MQRSKIMPNERVGFLDLETSNLKADFGIILSYCIKDWKGKILCDTITQEELRSNGEDKNITRKCIRDMKKFDRIVTFFGRYFDIPFLRSRALKHGLSFPLYREIWHTDVWFWVRKDLKLHGNRLQFACDFLDIPSKAHKLHGGMWTKALTGRKAALRYILTHNKEDVESLEQVFEKLLPFNKLAMSGL